MLFLTTVNFYHYLAVLRNEENEELLRVLLCFYQSWRKIYRPLYFCMGYHCKPGNNDIVILTHLYYEVRARHIKFLNPDQVQIHTGFYHFMEIGKICHNKNIFSNNNNNNNKLSKLKLRDEIIRRFASLHNFEENGTGQYRVWIPRTQNLTLKRSEYNQVWDYFCDTELEIRGRPTRVGINTVRGGLGKTCTMIYTMIIYIFTSNFTENHLALFASFHIVIKELGPVLKRLISTSPGLKFCSTSCIYLPMHCLE